tara:strand:- start:431 stop:2464 length:2034 start_codon:yes stop_codon:yes gene_type:complete
MYVVENEYLKYLDELKKIAIAYHGEKGLNLKNKIERYHAYNYKTTNARGELYNANQPDYNIIKPIVDTVKTISLDAYISTQVKIKNLNHQSLDQINIIESIADILDDVWSNVKINTQLDNKLAHVLKDSLVYGFGVVKTFWSKSASETGMGDVSIERINPQDFYPEPNATSIENANYIFVKRVISKFELIKEYKNQPKILKKIEKLTTYAKHEKIDEQASGKLVKSNHKSGEGQPESSGTSISEDKSTVFSPQSNIVIWECYQKDDTVLVPLDKDESKIKTMKTEERFKYPNGRVTIYSGNEILEDKAIDYPFGFPFDVLKINESDTIHSDGIVQPLAKIQDSIFKSYDKLNTLIQKYQSFLVTDPMSINKNDIANKKDIVEIKPGGRFNAPVIVTNKLIQDIQLLREHIEQLKQDAYKTTRINEIMLYGERPTGVNSGKMVRDLIESPMSAIREIQRNYKTFLKQVSDKAIILIQLYYNQDRIIRMTSGKMISIQRDQFENTFINQYQKDENNKLVTLTEEIQADLTLGEYEIEITTGSSLPQSQAAIASTTVELAQQGVFGDISNPDVKELILKTLDYPNYRAIVNKIRDEQAQMQQMDEPEPEFQNYLKNVSMSLKDITEFIQLMPIEKQQGAVSIISESLGIGLPEMPMTPMPEQEIIEPVIDETNPPLEVTF